MRSSGAQDQDGAQHESETRSEGRRHLRGGGGSGGRRGGRGRRVVAGALTAIAMAGIAGPGLVQAAPAQAVPAASQSAPRSSTGELPFSPTDVISKGYDAYTYLKDCKKNMDSGHPCMQDRTEAQFQDLSNQIKALSEQITAENAQIQQDISSVNDRVRRQQLQDAYNRLGDNLAVMRIVAAKESDDTACLAALQATSVNMAPGGNHQVATCTLTNANGNPELDGQGHPIQHSMASMADFQSADGPRARLLNATLKAQWMPQSNDPAKVFNAFQAKGSQIQAAMAGTHEQAGRGGLLDYSFHNTIESAYEDDAAPGTTVAQDTAPAFISGETVNQVNRFNTYFVGLQTDYWLAAMTAMQSIQPPATGVAPRAAAGATLGSGFTDVDYAATLRDAAANGINGEPEQGLGAQASNWSLPVWNSSRTVLSASNQAAPDEAFMIPWTNPVAHAQTYAFQTARTTHVKLDGNTSNRAPDLDINHVPSKSLLDTWSDRLVDQRLGFQTVASKHDAELPAVMWANMGPKTETVLLDSANANPHTYNDQGHSDSITTAWPADAKAPGWQAPGKLIAASTQSDQPCVAPVRLWDKRPGDLQLDGQYLSDNWPTYRKNTDYEPGGYHQTVYSGFQMFTNHQHMWVEAPDHSRNWSLGTNGQSLYDEMNPSAALPVYDVLWSRTGAGYHDDPYYQGDGLGYAMRCGGVDHASQSDGFLKASATDTFDITPIMPGSAGSLGGWANLVH